MLIVGFRINYREANVIILAKECMNVHVIKAHLIATLDT